MAYGRGVPIHDAKAVALRSARGAGEPDFEPSYDPALDELPE